MLYHVTATHTPDNCPLYNPDLPLKQDFRITPVESTIALTSWAEREGFAGR